MLGKLLLICFLLSGSQLHLNSRSATLQAVTYLQGEYNPTLGLYRESPETAPDRHWLATDNLLAVYALTGEWKGPQHGLIEALTGQVVEWPPRGVVQAEVAPGVWQERRTGEGVFEDWRDYTDLLLYGALNAHNAGQPRLAHQLYTEAVTTHWNGVGFADKAFHADSRYATYKVALAVIVATEIGEPPGEGLLDVLLSKQAPSGGFVAMYDASGQPVGDTNTETTAYALLALR
ncbi:hypothetical protein GC175_17010 [bacterium]|nr:hypothetical protein [bacterium]